MQQMLPPPLPLLGQDGQDLWFVSNPVVDVINTDFHQIAIFSNFSTMVTVN